LVSQKDFSRLSSSIKKAIMSEPSSRAPARRTPAKGVKLSLGGANWVFLTVCTSGRARWLAQPTVNHSLHQIWEKTATAWLVSDYLLMPDHLHLFCAPHDLKFTIERWLAFWKDRITKTHSAIGTFQAGGFHHRLRNGESYAQKWQYVRENPVRAGLVARPEDWPFCGRVHDIHWSRD
jgi:putative transposase